MCQPRRWPLQIPWAGQPSKTAPQPVREASVVSILRRQHVPRVAPKVRNWGLNHIERVRSPCCVTLSCLWGLALGWNPLALSHNWNGLMCRRPKGITVEAAAMRPRTLWKWCTVNFWPSLMFFRVSRMDSKHTWVSWACIVTEFNTTLRYVALWAGEKKLFLALSLNPRDSRWARTTFRCQSTSSWDWAKISQSSMSFKMWMPWGVFQKARLTYHQLNPELSLD